MAVTWGEDVMLKPQGDSGNILTLLQKLTRVGEQLKKLHAF